MKAKSPKWAAESLVKETESKTPRTPKQQREAGTVTLEMLSAAFGGSLGKEAIKKIFLGRQAKKVSSQKIKEIQNVIKKARKGELDKEKISVALSDIATDTLDKSTRVLKQGKEAYRRSAEKSRVGKSLKNLRKEQNTRKKKRLNPSKRKRPLSADEIALGGVAAGLGIAKSATLLDDSPTKAKGGYVKKYAKGGGVRKVRS
jgi:hypothetical protein